MRKNLNYPRKLLLRFTGQEGLPFYSGFRDGYFLSHTLTGTAAGSWWMEAETNQDRAKMNLKCCQIFTHRTPFMTTRSIRKESSLGLITKECKKDQNAVYSVPIPLRKSLLASSKQRNTIEGVLPPSSRSQLIGVLLPYHLLGDTIPF